MLILVVDDDSTQREMLKGFLINQGFQVLAAANGAEALHLFKKEPVQLVLLDHQMPDMTGDIVLEKMKILDPLLHAIIITAYGSIDTVVKTMKLGADEFFEKPIDLTLLLEKIKKIEKRVALEKELLDMEETIDSSGLPLNIIAKSDEMKEVLSLVGRMAKSSWPVLVSGETGTGKELISRLIHLMSGREDASFIDVNCAAIPENLFESELFGHVKGAFTGAVSHRKGCFKMAHGGTLLMDEIGEMPPALQPKLLRAIQEQRIKSVGSEAETSVDVRLISATNRNLKEMVSQGRFREDLYYRIKVLEVEIPPLRQRRKDIPVLLDAFLKRYSKRKLTFTPEALKSLIKYHFPGNVRELEHIVQRSVTLARGNTIGTMDLPEEIRYCEAAGLGSLKERLASVEHEMLKSALEKAGWVQTKAAATLGISERVLRYKMKKAGIKNNLK